MSEISITRFQPAVVTGTKVNSVQAVDNELGDEHTDNKPDDKGSGKQGSGKQGSGKQESGKQDAGKQAELEKSRAANKSPSSATSKSVDPDLSAEDILEDAVTKLNHYVQTVKRDIVFDIDPVSQEPSVTVVDRESRKVLRQFDTKEALELAKQIESDEPISLFKAEV